MIVAAARFVALALLALALSSCGRLTEGETVLEYGQECASRIAEIPAFDCANGAEAWITVDGLRVPDVVPFEAFMACDRPALLPYGDHPGDSDGQCVPGSRAQVLMDTESVQISAFCRNKFHRPGDTRYYDEIDVIAHSVTSGSTCWFHAEGNGRDAPLDGSRVPPPNEPTPPPGHPSAMEFWKSPEFTANEGCGTCHDNDPFYYSPWVAQTGQVPANPFGRYANDIGEAFKAWPEPRSMEIRGNTCLGCHRIGATHTCGEGTEQTLDVTSPSLDDWARSWPHSHWMPVDNPLTEDQWEVSYARSVAALVQCCEQIREGGPLPRDCKLTPIEP